MFIPCLVGYQVSNYNLSYVILTICCVHVYNYEMYPDTVLFWYLYWNKTLLESDLQMLCCFCWCYLHQRLLLNSHRFSPVMKRCSTLLKVKFKVVFTKWNASYNNLSLSLPQTEAFLLSLLLGETKVSGEKTPVLPGAHKSSHMPTSAIEPVPYCFNLSASRTKYNVWKHHRNVIGTESEH